MPRPPLPLRDLAELLKLMAAHHPAVYLVDEDPERVEVLLDELSRTSGLPLIKWAPGRGLGRHDSPHPIANTTKLSGCLSHIIAADHPVIYQLVEADEALTHPTLTHLVHKIAKTHRSHRGVVVFSGTAANLPDNWRSIIPMISLSSPTRDEYFEFVRSLLQELRTRMRIEMQMTSEDVGRMLALLQGMSFSLARRILTEAMVLDGVLSPDDLEKILAAKKEVIAQGGILEYYPVDTNLEDIAGLEELKRWLTLRGRAFFEPQRAREFGLDPARGVLLLGVQGCGKSLAAKAIAKSWSLPLVRLDPGRLYDKYMGESEKNLHNALRQCEALAPIVLWIDEIEKSFGPANDQDGGASQRIFGTLLTWLQEKKSSVFVMATSNDISRLPPELIRKGRFDEIFFVDLPREDIRAEILAVHLRKRDRNPLDFDLGALAKKAEGFSGAELEQAVVGALYAAFATSDDLTDAHLMSELEKTRPLSVTMREPIEKLRAWARPRTVAADAP
jgi:AAA+ superfamily predicted ATPase